MDNPQATGSDAYGSGREFKITAAMLKQLPAAGGQIILGDLPLGTVTQMTRLWITAAVTGVGSCTAQLATVDMSQSPPVVVNSFGSALDVTQAPSATTAPVQQLATGNVEPINKPTALALIIAGATVNAATGGAFSAFARYVSIAPAPALRYDTTAQTPRVMPAY